MFGLAQDGHRTRHGAVGIDQLLGREGGTALLALVAIGAVVAALGTRTDDITVGEERSGLLVVILHGRFLDELALVVELAEEIGRRDGMRRRRSARIDVERHAQALERILDDPVVTVDNLLRRDPLLAGLDGDGYTVLVRSADRHDVAAPQTQVTRVDVGGDIDARQMADVHGTVGVGESRSNQVTLELFRHDLQNIAFQGQK